MNHSKTKIAIITTSLGGGGAERSSALLSILLSDLGYDIHVVTVLDDITYDYKGKLLNLGSLKNNNDTLFGRFNRLIVFNKFLKENNFDWIIDNRIRSSTWSELVISRFVYNPSRVIYVVRNFNVGLYFPKIKFIAKRIYKESPYIIAVCDDTKYEIQKEYGYKNVLRIYNPIDKIALLNAAKDEIKEGNFILSYGRIDDEVKNYSLLIEGYSKSILPKNNIALYIIGDGKDVEKLKHKVKQLALEDKIIFKPKLVNPFGYVKSALFTVLTSRHEGFPRVIIESLALGTPVISVDCTSGPREIIENRQNGLLIENYNPNELTKAMNLFIEDSVLYNYCKNNASKSVSHLSLQSISNEWQKILLK